MKILPLQLVVIISLLSICSLPRLVAQQNFWAARAGGADTTGIESALAIVIDANHQTYIAGQFTGEATFGTIHVSSHGGADAFIAKLDAKGEFVWVRTGGGRGNDYINALALNADGGVTGLGVFSDTATFDTSHLTTFRRSYFLERLDSTGEQEWTRAITLEGEGDHAGVCVGPSGSLYAAYGTHISKFSSAGTIQWDLRPGVIALENSIGLSQFGQLYVTGQFGNSVQFGSRTLTSPGLFDYDLFVARLDTNGNAVWAKSAGSRTPLSMSDAGIDLNVDVFGGVIVTGTYFGRAGFGADTIEANDTTGSFAVKYASNGNVVWLKNLGFPPPVFATCVTTGSDAYVAVAGFSGADHTGTGGIDTRRWFIDRIDSDGLSEIWMGGYGSSSVQPLAISATQNSSLTLAGSFHGTANFFGIPLSSDGGEDVFATSFPLLEGVADEPTSLVPKAFELSLAYPNPFNPSTNIVISLGSANKFPAHVQWSVYDVTGKLVNIGESLTISNPGETTIQFTPGGLATGVYYVNVFYGAQSLTRPVLYIR